VRLSKAWVVAEKDLAIFRKKKSIIYSIVIFAVLASVGLPLTLQFGTARTVEGAGIPASDLPTVIGGFSFFFIIGAATLPTAIASYSLVGEKIQKSLEPLLATPTTDGEILLGKAMAAFIPPMAGTYIGAIIFMVLIDRITYPILGYLYFPNWDMGIILFLLAPLASILSIELDIIVSSRVNDVRTAQQVGGIVALPFVGIYALGQAGALSLNAGNLLIISAIVLIVDVALFYLSRATFRREEIFTKWK
jgi:ABC-type Na+ efflux pump permease subunit